jgi:hypothetical protein
MENLVQQGVQVTPEIPWMAAVAYNELAFHSEVPVGNWSVAERHYRRSIELFQHVDQPLEAANVELNLQVIFHLSGQPVDVERVKELTRILEKARDKRVQKGRELLSHLEKTE